MRKSDSMHWEQQKVLIVAKCIVNIVHMQQEISFILVLIVAKCIVNNKK